MKHLMNGVILIALITTGIAAQTPPTQSVAVERLGPQVGDLVPDFSALDQFGRMQTLKSVMGRSGTMLVFNRSADW